MQNFKFVASQEVRHLLRVFAVSLKEAKSTFLIPKDEFGLKEAVCKI